VEHRLVRDGPPTPNVVEWGCCQSLLKEGGTTRLVHGYSPDAKYFSRPSSVRNPPCMEKLSTCEQDDAFENFIQKTHGPGRVGRGWG
jgi:hypothetical protein